MPRRPLTPWCGTGFKAHRVPGFTSAHFVDNPASGRVLAKLGFEPAGRGWIGCAARGHDVRGADLLARPPARARRRCRRWRPRRSQCMRAGARGSVSAPPLDRAGIRRRVRQAMKFLDQAKIYIRSGDGGGGRDLVPPREVHRVRRPRRRRRRQGRRRLGGVRRQPQHADRLSLPAALQGQERHGRHGQEPIRPGRRGCRDRRAARHAGARRGPGDAAGRAAASRAIVRASPRAATAASATRISSRRPTRRRATPIPASPARS